MVTGPTDDFTATLPRKRMAAGLLITDAVGRILLVEPVYKDTWEIPGGSVEADESPRDAAGREVKEELGLSVSPGRLLVVDWMAARPGRTEAVMFVYHGGVLDPARTADIRLPPEELRGWAWCSASEVDSRVPGCLARRLAAAAYALEQGAAAYLENGVALG